MNLYVSVLEESFQFFRNSTSCLEEADSNFSPGGDVYTVSQHIAHVALTFDWFLDPLKTGNSFNMDFEKHDQEARSFNSLKEAQEKFESSAKNLLDFVKSKDESFFTEKLPEGPIMGGEPKKAVIEGITDHTAHHRGALSVYSRLIGKVPSMPYGDF